MPRKPVDAFGKTVTVWKLQSGRTESANAKRQVLANLPHTRDFYAHHRQPPARECTTQSDRALLHRGRLYCDPAWRSRAPSKVDAHGRVLLVALRRGLPAPHVSLGARA